MPLLSIDTALERVAEQTPTGQTEIVSLTASTNRILAVSATARDDSPPFAKSMMDGFAVRGVQTPSEARWPVIGEIAAGSAEVPDLPEASTVRIMTGAPVPADAEAVIPVELADFDASDSTVRFTGTVRPLANILPQGEIARINDVIVEAGSKLGPGQIAALAEFGHADVTVYGRPRVAILATGDELVPYDQQPSAGQIRNSNGPMLAALVEQMGAEAVPLGIARDNVDDLDRLIGAGLQADILLLSGGVSAGQYDLVPERLAAAGVEQVFHKVAIKPGKPIWFGKTASTLVFGLPGNPVSSLVCGKLFAGAAIRRLLGGSALLPVETGTLSATHRQKGDRTTYWPAISTLTDDGLLVKPLPWQGSADLVRVAAANSWAIFPPGDRQFGLGDSIDVLLDSH